MAAWRGGDPMRSLAAGKVNKPEGTGSACENGSTALPGSSATPCPRPATGCLTAAGHQIDHTQEMSAVIIAATTDQQLLRWAALMPARPSSSAARPKPMNSLLSIAIEAVEPK